MTIKLKKLKNFLPLMLLSLALISCGSSEDSELQNYINKIKMRHIKPIDPIPQFESSLEFSYPEEEKRRSPFKPILPETLPDTFSPRLDRPKQPLEAFALDSLKFVGVLKENSTIWALISQPDGLISRVKRGDYMGKNYGQILNIKDDLIEIEESVQISGRWEKRPITLKLTTSKI